MRLTDAVVVDSEFRTWRKAETLKARIRRMQAYHRKNSAKDYSPVHDRKAEETIAKIDAEMANKNNAEDNNSSLSSRESILKKPVKNTIQHIFGDLRQPTAKQRTPLIQELLTTLEEKSRTQRCATYKFLLASEIAYRTHGNNCAYMVFNTLTVAPGEYYKVFRRNSKAFKEYIRAIDRRVQNHTYFGVVEEGAKNGRLHIHVLHFMDTLPFQTEDPNKGRIIPNRRELTTFKKLWSYGYSTPIGVRYSPNDAYGKLGWRWPTEKDDTAPLKISSPLKLASYISKYITKSYISHKRSKLLWRIRKTHRLGTTLISKLTDNLSKETLAIIATTNNMTAKWNNWKIPPILLRQEALRSLNKKNKDLQSTTSPLDYTILTLAKQLAPRHSIAQSPHDLTKMIQENSQASTGFLTTLGINNEDTFKHAWREFIDLAKSINETYFRPTTHNSGTTSTRDHLY